MVIMSLDGRELDTRRGRRGGGVEKSFTFDVYNNCMARVFCFLSFRSCSGFRSMLHTILAISLCSVYHGGKSTCVVSKCFEGKHSIASYIGIAIYSGSKCKKQAGRTRLMVPEGWDENTTNTPLSHVQARQLL
jgi:hypothetical protein